jgi:hypothetical protein
MPTKCPRNGRTAVERIGNDLNRFARKYGAKGEGVFLREQGVGSSNLPAPTNVLRWLASPLFFIAHEMAHEMQFSWPKKLCG